MSGKSESEIHFTKPEISVQECRTYLCQNGEEYTDEEIKEIRTLLLNLVEIDYYYYQACKERKEQGAKIISLNPRADEERRAA